MPKNFRSMHQAGIAALILLAASAQQARAAATCGGQGNCLDAVMAAARTGREADALELMKEMRKQHHGATARNSGRRLLPQRAPDEQDAGNVDLVLTRLVREADASFNDLPEYHRALALTYLKTGRIDDAHHLLEAELEANPVYAPYWMDLAIVFARQGQHERAVSALVVADAWTGNQAALRQAYQRAAQDTPEAGMGPDYAAALRAIAANAAEEVRQDAALPVVQAAPLKGAAPDSSRTPGRVDFQTCDTPEYPKAALRYGETGAVTIRFLVGTDGRVLRVRKTKSSGHPQLDNAAALALGGCRFVPATDGGKPVATWQPVQYVWTLD